MQHACLTLLVAAKSISTSAAISQWTQLQKSVIERAPGSTDLDKRRQFKMESTL
jgi:hypothetical protein